MSFTFHDKREPNKATSSVELYDPYEATIVIIHSHERKTSSTFCLSISHEYKHINLSLGWSIKTLGKRPKMHLVGRYSAEYLPVRFQSSNFFDIKHSSEQKSEGSVIQNEYSNQANDLQDIYTVNYIAYISFHCTLSADCSTLFPRNFHLYTGKTHRQMNFSCRILISNKNIVFR